MNELIAWVVEINGVRLAVLLTAIQNAINRSRTALSREAEIRRSGTPTRCSAAANGRSWHWWSPAG